MYKCLNIKKLTKILPIMVISVLSLSMTDPVKTEPLKIKDYSYLINKTKFNKSLMQMHLTLYEGYVNNTNAIFALFSALGTSDTDLIQSGALKRRLSWEYDGVRLHELFFDNLGGNGKLDAQSTLYKALQAQFGSLDAWKQEFIKTGKTRGIGWVILMNDPQNGRLTNFWVDEHNIGILSAGNPLLVMDVWEHAYITQFGLDRVSYINTFLSEVDYAVVEARYCGLNASCTAESKSKRYQNDQAN